MGAGGGRGDRHPAFTAFDLNSRQSSKFSRSLFFQTQKEALNHRTIYQTIESSPLTSFQPISV